MKSDLLLTDEKNLELVRQLQSDPRQPVSELARRIGMSHPAVKERVARLEEAGIITGYKTEVDPAALGFAVVAFVRIRPLPGHLPKIAELARQILQVTECHRITGEDCFILKVHLEDISSLDRVLDRFLAHGQTTTSIVQSSPVPPRALPLPKRRPIDSK